MKIPLERWSEVERWLLAAVEYPAGERSDFLDKHCPDDLRPLVDRLVRGLEDPDSQEGRLVDGGWIQDAVADAAAHATERGRRREQPSGEGVLIGDYRLDEQIGRGGMGVVYRAARINDPAETPVALKVLRTDLVSDEAVLRFRRERVMLSAAASDNVPGLVDAGTTADGRPFYVMEFVDGLPILEYIEQHAVALPERLDLFDQLCRSVQQMHDQLVIHRDLKPSNIFISGGLDAPMVMLLDFGVATLIDKAADSLTATTMRGDTPEAARSVLTLTQDGRAPHTPEYAAPEQRQGGDITALADVFALGALLCRLVEAPGSPQRRIFPFCSPKDAGPLLDSSPDCELGGLCRLAARFEPSDRLPSALVFAERVASWRQSQMSQDPNNQFPGASGSSLR